MKKVDKKHGNILKLKQFSDSEEEEEENESNQEVDNHSEEDEEMAVENNSDDELFEMDPESENEEEAGSSNSKKKKIKKKGIIFIGSIPQHMNVAICREMMEQFGEVGRIFLQPDKKGSKRSSFIISVSNNP